MFDLSLDSVRTMNQKETYEHHGMPHQSWEPGTHGCPLHIEGKTSVICLEIITETVYQHGISNLNERKIFIQFDYYTVRM